MGFPLTLLTLNYRAELAASVLCDPFVCVIAGELESVPPPPGMALNRLGDDFTKDFPATGGRRHEKCLISFLSHLKNIENGLGSSFFHDSGLPESADRFDLFISAWALAAVEAAGSSTALLCFLVYLFFPFQRFTFLSVNG